MGMPRVVDVSLLLVAEVSGLTCSRMGRKEKPAPSGSAGDGGDIFIQWTVQKAHSGPPTFATYDDAEFHSQTVSDAHLPGRNAATHIGLFLAWLITRDLAADAAETAADRAAVKSRSLTGAQFLMRHCDGKLLSTDLTQEGRAFADSYYSDAYFSDYERVLATGLPSTYHVEDSWKSFDAIAPIIDQRYGAWKKERRRPTRR